MGNGAPGATSWGGTPFAASVANPKGETSVAEGFGGSASSYAQTFTVPVASSYQLDRICLYAGGGTGTSGAAPLRINLYDLGGQSAPNPSGYTTGTNLLGGGAGLSIPYTAQANGVLQLDFSGDDRVVLIAGRLYAFELAGTSGTNPITWLRGTTDTFAAGAAYRNRSWINGSNARDFALAVYGTPAATPATASTIDATISHQVIDGFGAGAAYLDAGIRQLTDAQMDALYGTGPNQMGLTLIRVRISPTGAADWGDPIANGQKAHRRGARILASPWTPPVAMKDSGVIHTGSLLPAQYGNYVAFLNLFTDTMAANGAPVSVVSLQNEADYDPEQEYDACLWTPAQFVTFCRDFAGGIKVPVMMPESFSFQQSLSDPALADPASAANIGYIGGHLYSATIRDYPLARARRKPVWMTEYLENNQTIESAVATAQQIHDCLATGNMGAYIWWKTIGNANGLLNAAGELQRRAYVMGQFSRFIRPGDVRIAVPANDSSLGVSAYRNPAAGTFAIVAVNNTGAAVRHTFHLQGMTAAAVTPWVTSATDSLAEKAPVPVATGTFAYDIPARAVVTFVGAASAPPVVFADPESRVVVAGGLAALEVAAGGPGLNYQWFRNGRAVTGIPSATTATLQLPDFTPEQAGLYDCTVENATGRILSRPAVVGVVPASGQRTIGAVSTRAEWQNIRHPNGNEYDQFLLSGRAGTFTADPNQIARMSYLDPQGSIVQVEMSGAGAITVVLDPTTASGPKAPALYNQSGVEYMQGQATIILAGADETTHFTIYSVGTATNPGVTRPDANYFGWADVAAAGIVSPGGKLGGVHQGNVLYRAAVGPTGLYAPTVLNVGSLIVVHDIAASSDAQPYLQFGPGGNATVKIAGGSLAQPNGDALTVDGLPRITLGAGQDSCGRGAPAQPLGTRLLDPSGNDVTRAVLGGP